jgi:hypothetical protein
MNINLINAKILRQFWSVVEQTQSSTILALNDPDLVKLLLRQIESKTTLNNEETSTLSDYIYSKTVLIRDLAQTYSA